MRARQKKKNRRNSIIIVDTLSIPKDLDIYEWYDIFNKSNIIFWDSYQNGNEPKVYPKKNKVLFKIKQYE